MIGVLQKQNAKQKEEIFEEKGLCLILIIMDGTITIGITVGTTITGKITDGIIIVTHSFLDGNQLTDNNNHLN